MRWPPWLPIPHQQVENNTLLFFPDAMCKMAWGSALPFSSYKEEHRSVSSLIRQQTVLLVLIRPRGRLSTRRPPNRANQQAFELWCSSLLGFRATSVLVNFGSEANFALQWSPNSGAKLREFVSDYTQFDWWGPVSNATQIVYDCYSTCSSYLHFTWAFIFLMTLTFPLCW